MKFSELGLLEIYGFRSTQPLLVDVGAHHGSISATFARKGWQVIAFEPEEKNRAAFERNLAGFDHVSCIPKAVSNITRNKVPFYVSKEHYGIHSIKPFHETHELAYEVETIRLDDVLLDLNISSVTFLKIDIEGADFLALKGFDIDKYHPELIMIEFMDERSLANFGYTHHDVVTYMKERGYTTFVSEWEPIKEYGREGIFSEPHVWIQCTPYPLDHKPAWGNLIFVPDGDKDKFVGALQLFLRKLKQAEITASIRNQIKKIPGFKGLYRSINSR
ncbi:MAG: FkbM family methyltransferase [Moorea sp. SIO4E2]|uniref:FkbM family methyltransferase n=1 Tax=Moorena sp. SIO4E2 TaxID=2607826 RepID=UPI0013BB04A2|nr:FkbM family methyltransferase [Moorena sp. SIO4E2]NEQ09521.1 FkbM family methyltransferase [Moorena sp. SIO4E2]